MAKLIINENTFKKMVVSNMLCEENITKKDIIDMVKRDSEFEKAIKDLMQKELKNDKEVEKKIKEVSANILEKFFRTLWQKSAFYISDIKN